MKWVCLSLLVLNLLFLGMNWQALDRLPDQSDLTRHLMQQGKPLVLLNNDAFSESDSFTNNTKENKSCYKLYSHALSQQAVQAIIKLLTQWNVQAYQNKETENYQWLYLKFPRESWAKQALDTVKSHITNAYMINETSDSWLVSLGTYRHEVKIRQIRQKIEQLGYQVYSQPRLQSGYTIHINRQQDAERFTYLLQTQELLKHLRAAAPTLNVIKISCTS